MSSDGPVFTLRVRQNPYLALGASAMHAVLQIRAEAPDPGEGAGDAAVPSAAEVIIIDTSSSMSGPKVLRAADAAAAAVDVLRDGVAFAVIAGESEARMIYPARPRLANASDRTRQEAKQALRGVAANGGTSMSTWLRLADRLFAGSSARIKHALMLTDGQNVEGEAPLTQALAECSGRFVCDCRGVGDDWRLDQLKQIAAALHGGWKPIAEPGELEADFREVTSASMRKRVTDVVLRVRRPPASTLGQILRVFPDIEDLTARVAPSCDGRALDVPLGAWAPGEQRAYHVRFDLTQAEIGIEDEGRAAAGVLQVLAELPGGGSVATSAEPVYAVWTRDNVRALVIHPVVAQYTGQEELAAAMRAAMKAYGAQDADAAQKLGRVVALAHDLQRHDLLERISQIAIIEDPALGVVRIRPGANAPSTRYALEWITTQTSWSDGRAEGGDR